MNYQAPPPDKSNVMTTVAVAAIVASIAANLFLLYQVNGLKDDTAAAFLAKCCRARSTP